MASKSLMRYANSLSASFHVEPPFAQAEQDNWRQYQARYIHFERDSVKLLCAAPVHLHSLLSKTVFIAVSLV
jgi:hypothetical protein